MQENWDLKRQELKQSISYRKGQEVLQQCDVFKLPAKEFIMEITWTLKNLLDA